MRILVTGAGGFLGRSVVARLLQRGHSVRAVVRPKSLKPAWSSPVEVFNADLRVCEDLSPAFDGMDAVMHLAAATSGNEDLQFASTVVATERLLNAMAQTSVKRLVHVSSLVVYDWSKARNRMDEGTPLEDDMYRMGPYTIAKIWQERIVRRLAEKHNWQLSIARPGFIWGPGHEEIAGMGRKFGKIYVMFGPFTRLPLTYVENCADCLSSIIENPKTSGEILNIVDSDNVRVWRYVREYSRRTDQRGLMLPVPYRVGLAMAQTAALISRRLFGKRGRLPSLLTPRRFESQFKPLRFSNLKLKSVVSWTAPHKFEDCLTASYGSTPVGRGLPN